MLSKTAILDLPQELIIRLSSHLTTVDLGHFRRSCKQIERYLYNSFVKEFFTKRQFLLEHESLEALLGIANHPGLSSHLEEVIIDVRVFAPNDEYARFMRIRRQNGNLNHARLVYTGQALSMLTEIFSKLPRLRSIGVRDRNGWGRAREGERGLWRPWGWSYANSVTDVLTYPPNIDSILPLIMSALTRADARPTKLEMLLYRQPFPGRHSFATKDTVDFADVLGSLKMVMLKIATTQIEANLLRYNDDSQLEYIFPIIQFLHSLKTLEHLRLNFDSWNNSGEGIETALLTWLSGEQLQRDYTETEYPIVSALDFPTLAFPTLTTLEIGSMSVDSERLMKVLLQFNLKSFSLWRVTLLARIDIKKDVNCWLLFLLDLARQLPKSSNICKILIGHASQAVLENRWHLRQIQVSWKLADAKPGTLEELQRDDTIKYDSVHSNENARKWLTNISRFAVVESGDSGSEIDEEDEEDLGDEYDSEIFIDDDDSEPVEESD